MKLLNRLVNIAVFGLLMLVFDAFAVPIKSEPKVVGGHDAGPVVFPWMVSLQLKPSGRHFCGATLIHSRFVLTAAHCVENLLASSIQAVVGVRDLQHADNEGITVSVDQIFIHSHYHVERLQADLAVLRLAWALPVQKAVDLVSDREWEDSDEATYWVLGWGDTLASPDLESFPSILQQAQVDVISRQSCQQAYAPGQVTAGMLCAGKQRGGVDACQGDSGGPLLVVDEGQVQQIGLVSFGQECGAFNAPPGVYTDVSFYSNFWQGIIRGSLLPLDLKWWGVGQIYTSRLFVTNFHSTFLRLGTLTGDYSRQVAVSGLACEQAVLAVGESCQFGYRFLPMTVGSFVERTTLPVMTEPQSEFEAITVVTQGSILPQVSVATAWDVEGVTWYSGGDVPWILDTKFTFDGATMRSGSLRDVQQSVLVGHINGPMTLNFAVATDTEADYDQLTIKLNDRLVEQLSGQTNWRLIELDIPAGKAQLVFEYRKDGSVQVGRDVVWLDFVDANGQDFVGQLMREGGAVVQNTRGGGVSVWGLYLWSVVVLVMGLSACQQQRMDTERASSADANTQDLMVSQKKVGKAELGDRSKEVVEPLYQVKQLEQALEIQVKSHGCTLPQHFVIREDGDDSGKYAILRTKPDYCRRAPGLVVIKLKLPADYQGRLIRLSNPIMPSFQKNPLRY